MFQYTTKDNSYYSAAAGVGLGEQPGVQVHRVQDIAAAATGAIVGEQFQTTFDQLTQQEKNEVVKVEMFSYSSDYKSSCLDFSECSAHTECSKSSNRN